MIIYFKSYKLTKIYFNFDRYKQKLFIPHMYIVYPYNFEHTEIISDWVLLKTSKMV